MKGNSQWFLCDDSYVEPVSEGTVLRQKDAYVLFYCRKEVKLEFPAPPPRGSMSAEEAKKLGRVRARARADSLASEDGKSSKTPQPRKRVHSNDPEDCQEFRATVAKGDHKATSRVSASKNGLAKRTKTFTHPLASPSLGFHKHAKDTSSDSSNSLSDINSVSGSEQGITRKFRDSYVNTKDTARYAGKTGLTSLSHHARIAGKASTTCLARHHGTEATEGTTANRFRLDSIVVVKEESKKPVSNSAPVEKPESESSWGDTSESSSDEPNMDAPDKKPTPGSRENLSLNFKKSTGGKGGKERQSKQSSSESSSSVEDVDSDDACMGTPEPVNSPRTNHLNSTARNLETAFSGRDDVLDLAEKESWRKESKRTRVVLERGDSHGKVEVMLGPRRGRRAWQAAQVVHGGGKGFELLGNVGVSQWGEGAGGNDRGVQAGNGPFAESSQDRAAVVKQMEKQERKRKRQRHLDRWDALLDQGKVSNSISAVYL